jgi:hypothetical protein
MLMLSIIFIVLSGQNLLTPKQRWRIEKLKRPTYKKTKNINKYSPKMLLIKLLRDAGFDDQISLGLDFFKIFAFVTFFLSVLIGVMLGFPLIGSIIFGAIALVISPFVPIMVLIYLRATRNTLITGELYLVMTHIIDAVQGAGKTLQGGLEDALYAAPTLQPYLRRFLNTYLMVSLDKAVEDLRKTIRLEEMGLFLDLLAHGFEHTTQELTAYFQSESEAYHELGLAAKQKRMERREVLFDVVVVFPFILSFLIMIYPVFMQGSRAINGIF